MIKSFVQRSLKTLGLYEWFKGESFAYDLYSKFKTGRPLAWRRREVLFYRSLVGTGPGRPLIFDVGANRGTKTSAFLQLGAEVVAIDPDEANLRILARKFHGPFRKRPLTIIGKAVSDTVRTETYWVTCSSSGLNTLSKKWVDTLKENPGKLGAAVDFPTRREVETTTLAQLIESHGVPRYIKIDVEGHEREVLRGLRRPVPLVSFEANLPEFRPEAVECIEMLVRLSKNGRFNLTGSDAYKGFILDGWRSGAEITKILSTLGEMTVEVYWTTD
jgi:FkbM family methyltransferase